MAKKKKTRVERELSSQIVIQILRCHAAGWTADRICEVNGCTRRQLDKIIAADKAVKNALPLAAVKPAGVTTQSTQRPMHGSWTCETSIMETLTFRDRCAIAAMQSLIGNPVFWGLNGAQIAERAFASADAMRAERDKGIKLSEDFGEVLKSINAVSRAAYHSDLSDNLRKEIEKMRKVARKHIGEI